VCKHVLFMLSRSGLLEQRPGFRNSCYYILNTFDLTETWLCLSAVPGCFAKEVYKPNTHARAGMCTSVFSWVSSTLLSGPPGTETRVTLHSHSIRRFVSEWAFYFVDVYPVQWCIERETRVTLHSHSTRRFVSEWAFYFLYFYPVQWCIERETRVTLHSHSIRRFVSELAFYFFTFLFSSMMHWKVGQGTISLQADCLFKGVQHIPRSWMHGWKIW